MLNTKEKQDVLFHTILSIVLGVAVFVVYYRFPVTYVSLITEDYWLEYASVVCWALASIIFLYAALKSKKRGEAIWWFVFMAFSVFVAGEEISWGQRIMPIEYPYILKKYNIQGEPTLHNLIFMSSFYHMVLGIALMVWVLVSIPQVRTVLRLNLLVEKLCLPLLQPLIVPACIVTIFFLFYNPLLKYDEISEFFFGFMIVLYGIHCAFLQIVVRLNPLLTSNVITSVLIAIILLTTLILVALFPGTKSFTVRLNRCAAVSYPNRMMFAQAEEIFQHIINHDEHMKNDTLLNYGIFLRKRGFMDKAGHVLQDALEDAWRQLMASPEKVQPHVLLARIYSELGHPQDQAYHLQKAYDKQKQIVDTAQQRGKLVGAYFLLVEILIEQQKYQDALVTLDKLVVTHSLSRKNSVRVAKFCEICKNAIKSVI